MFQLLLTDMSVGKLPCANRQLTVCNKGLAMFWKADSDCFDMLVKTEVSRGDDSAEAMML